MSTHEFHLDERTYARAKQLAQEKNVSVPELVSEAIERFTIADTATPQTPAAARETSETFEMSLEHILGPVLSAADELVAKLTEPLEQSTSKAWTDGLVAKFRAQGFRL